jgi:cytochrome c
MDTMEITKIVGAVCGSLLVFLLIQTAAHAIYTTHSEEVAYLIEGAETEGDGEEAPEEEAVDVAALVAEADPAGGEAVFKRCNACHKLDGTNAVGPHLDGVVGRDIASVEGFGYSDALTGLEGAWTPENIFAFIGSPKQYAPGTSMSFAGLPKPEDRADVIAYLESASN